MLQVETFGNAIVQFRRDGDVLLTSDPWLVGNAYFDSWTLEAPLSEAQLAAVRASKYVWISHGHPDHLHVDSLQLLPKDTTNILIPDHYDSEIKDFLVSQGFRVQVLKYKQWTRLDPDLQVLCFDNENQDAILVAKFGDMLFIDQNDSPTCGEEYFLRGLVRAHPNDKTVLAALCAVDADMLNIVDAQGNHLAGEPDVRKQGAVWAVSSYAAAIGVKHFCCSSSQHIYIRPDSVWANPYRIGWDDMRQHWIRPGVELHEPYTTLTVEPLCFTANNPAKTDPDIAMRTVRADDWSARLSQDEWATIERFVSRFDLIKDRLDFVGFKVGSERRDFALRPQRRGRPPRGIVFNVPRAPLLETVASGYFDDLLIGNFMKTELVNATLYPDFTPLVAKLAGNAKVYTHRDHARFLYRYFRRNPRAFVAARMGFWWLYACLPRIKRAAEALGLKPVLKLFYRRVLLGHPVEI